MQHGDAPEAGAEGGIAKTCVAVIFIESVTLVGEVGDQQIGPAVVVVVGKVHAHAGVGPAVAIDSNLREQACLLEGAVTFIVIEKFDHGIVGYEDVDFAVVVIIAESDSQALAGLGQSNFLADLGEMAVAVVVKNERGNGLENVGMAIGT